MYSKPLFSTKLGWSTYIALNEDEKLIKHDYEVVNTFNTFFNGIIANFGNKVAYVRYLYLSYLYYERYLCNASDISDPVAVVHPTHKKDWKMEKSIYRPISIFPNLSKIHDRIFFYQMYTNFSNFLLNITVIFIRDMVPNTAS